MNDGEERKSITEKAKDKANQVVRTVSENEKVQGVAETLTQANQQLLEQGTVFVDSVKDEQIPVATGGRKRRRKSRKSRRRKSRKSRRSRRRKSKRKTRRRRKRRNRK